MDQNSQNSQEIAIDLSQYIKMIIKRKKTLIAVVLLSLAIGFSHFLLSPKIYRASMMIQPPVTGPSLTGANDLETAENLKNLIINGFYNSEFAKLPNISSQMNDPDFSLGFKATIPDKTNMLRISIDLKSRKKELGKDLLQGLSKLISDSFAKSIEIKVSDILAQIKSNEDAIVKAKTKTKNLQEQINEIKARKDELEKEVKIVKENISQFLAKRDELLKNNPSENDPALPLAVYIQNNIAYANQLNNQLIDLSNRKVSLILELENNNLQISDFQMAKDKLNISKDFISNLKIIDQPRLFSNPVSPNKKRILLISITISLFLGVFVIFLQEYWKNNLAKK